MGDLFQPRKIPQQRLRWNAADIKKNVGMPPHQEERAVHPQRTSAVREKNLQVREINGDVVNINWITVFVARAGKDRRSGVHHDWNSIGFCSAIDDLQLLNAVEIVVWIQQLMRRMNLDQPDSKPHDLLHVGENVLGVTGMQAAAGNQPLRVRFHIGRDPLVDRRRKPNHFGGNVVDEHRAIDADLVHVVEKCARRFAVVLDLLEALARLLHQRQSLRLEQLHRRDVNVAVGDHR